MKTKENKKLELKKSTIFNLNSEQLNKIKGGDLYPASGGNRAFCSMYVHCLVN